MKRVLCFGDSNTWGTRPIADLARVERFEAGAVWSGVLASRLGPQWQVLSEGLPSRTTSFDDPVEGPYLNGRRYIRACLISHAPLDLIVVMLGGNDLKRRFNLTADEVAHGLDRLVLEIQATQEVTRDGARVLVVCPPPLKLRGPIAHLFTGVDVRGQGLARQYEGVANRRGVGFVDAGTVIASSEVDGAHFDESDHHTLGEHVADWIAMNL